MAIIFFILYYFVDKYINFIYQRIGNEYLSEKLIEQYEERLKEKDEQIAYWKKRAEGL
ncbi:hypothetical protein [Chryseobacterium lineare]